MGHTAKLAIIMGNSLAWMDGSTISGCPCTSMHMVKDTLNQSAQGKAGSIHLVKPVQQDRRTCLGTGKLITHCHRR